MDSHALSNMASIYSREDIERFVRKHVRFIEGDNLYLEHQERLRDLYVSIIEQLPPWRQMNVIEAARDVVIGQDPVLVRRQGTGTFDRATNTIFVRHFGIERDDANTYYDDAFAGTINHEEGHRVDYNLGSSGHYWSEDNPRWIAAMKKELARARSAPRVERAPEYDQLPKPDQLYNHVMATMPGGVQYYDPPEYPREALAEFDLIFHRVYKVYQGDWAAADAYMQYDYPDLWPVYRDEFIPELQKAVRRTNPNGIDEGEQRTALRNSQQYRGR